MKLAAKAKKRLIPPGLKLGILVILILILAFTLWLGVELARFSPPGPRSKTASPEAIPSYEIHGVYHIHTRYSDGRSTPQKIARIAARQGLDFIILTDHGNPNLRSLESQGWRDGVLVLAGSELSVSRGHLVALDISPPRRPFPQNAEDAARAIVANGGFSVIAHPFSKVRWSWGSEVEYAGLEIIDTDTMFKRNFWRALPYLPSLLFRPRFYLLKTLERPTQTLRKWDELNTDHILYGYFSADAHLLYRVLLTGFHLHLILDRPLAKEFGQARSQVFGALKEGRFFSAVNAAGEARGFRFWAEAGGNHFPMGSLIPAHFISVGLRLNARLPFRSGIEMWLLHNGKVVFTSTEGAASFAVTEPGTYRVEVYLRGSSPLNRNVPWVVSNPIFIREDSK